MLRFFRTIRGKLLKENKVRTYLLYAIGEILLVVIGILIALQINNWNEVRIEKNQEKVILKNLHFEFSQNLIQLNYDTQRIDTLKNALFEIISIIDAGPVQADEVELDKLISKAINSPTWNPSSYVLDDLKNSGGLSRLSNPELISLLFSWDRHYENLVETNSNIVKTGDAVLDYIKEYGSLRNADSQTVSFLNASKMNITNISLLTDVKFENVIDDHLFVSIYMLSELGKSKSKIEEILKVSK